MKKLIVSWDNYSWVKFCGGMILENPDNFEIIIFRNDSCIPMFRCKQLCQSAVHTQRKHDLRQLQDSIGINKIILLGYENSNDFYKVYTQLELYIALNPVTEIYYQDNLLLIKLFNKIAQSQNIESLKYGYVYPHHSKIKSVTLSDDIIEKKLKLSRYIIGAATIEDIRLYPIKEELFK